MENIKLRSSDERLLLSVNTYLVEKPKGIVVFSHGMVEYKERYEPFIHYLNEKGYHCVIHDHRGHGDSVHKSSDLGYFYDGKPLAIVDDLKVVINYTKENISNTLPIILFSHSMGTLVARNLIKQNDQLIDTLILCGPPTKNALAPIAYVLANTIKMVKGAKYKSNILQSLTFMEFNKKFGAKGGNEWLSVNQDNVAAYNQSNKSGYVFSVDGFVSLYKMLGDAYRKDYAVKNPTLPIYLICGSEDPVIVSNEKFKETREFFTNLGYTNVSSYQFKGLRHEILNENENNEIFEKIHMFLTENGV